jgi:predicted anti-sigma-YlaC factor YlaD
MNCYEAIDLMGDALENRVPPESRPGFDEHLGECPACRVYLSQLRTTVSALARLPRRRDSGGLTSELLAAFRNRPR